MSAAPAWRTVAAALDDHTDEGFSVWHGESATALRLNETAAHLWRGLRIGATAAALARSLAAAYPVRQAHARAQVDQLLASLRHAGLIEPCSGGGHELPPLAAPDAGERSAALRFIGNAVAPDPCLSGTRRSEGFWEAVAQLAVRHRVTEQLLLPHYGSAPGWLRARCAARRDAALRRNGRLREALERATFLLNRAGVTPVLLKGSAHLVTALHPDTAPRATSDIDLLLPADSLRTARTALAADGWRADPDPRVDYDAHHHAAPLYRGGDDIGLELHRAPVHRAFGPLLPTAVAWRHSVALPHPRLEWRLLDPSHRVLHALIHAQLADHHHALALLPLRDMIDVERLRRRHGSALDWRQIHAAFPPAYAAARDGFFFASRRLLGTPLPPQQRPLDGAGYWLRSAAAVRWPALARWNARLALFAPDYLQERFACELHAPALLRARLRCARETWRRAPQNPLPYQPPLLQHDKEAV